MLELVKAFDSVNEMNIEYEFSASRDGDVAVSSADVIKAERELNWKAEFLIDEMCRDSWNFQKNLKF